MWACSCSESLALKFFIVTDLLLVMFSFWEASVAESARAALWKQKGSSLVGLRLQQCLGEKVPWTAPSVKTLTIILFWLCCTLIQWCTNYCSRFSHVCLLPGEVLLHLPRHREGICQVRRRLSQVDQTIHGHQRHQQKQVCYRCWLWEVPGARNLLPSRGKTGNSCVKLCHSRCLGAIPWQWGTSESPEHQPGVLTGNSSTAKCFSHVQSKV